jgi:hypothetical protein
MATPKGSFASNSSNDKMSTDSGAESNSASTPKPDVMEKLFAPLKVRMVADGGSAGMGSKISALPFWQREAEMSEQVRYA